MTLTLNASLLCMVKQPNLKLEPVACVYFKVISAWWISAHPWEVRDRVCLARQVSVRFAGNLALISCTRPRAHPSLARVPEGLIRSYGRRSAGYQMLIMRSRMLTFAAVVRSCHATVSLQRGREGVAWRDKTMASKETTVCVKPMQLRDNKPLCAFTSDKLEVFSLSPSNSLSLSPMIYHALLGIYKWCIVKAAVWLVTLIAIYLTCRFHVALLLFSYVSQMTS